MMFDLVSLDNCRISSEIRAGADLHLINKAAFGASQCPVLEAGTNRGNALDFHARLALGATRPYRGARR